MGERREGSIEDKGRPSSPYVREGGGKWDSREGDERVRKEIRGETSYEEGRVAGRGSTEGREETPPAGAGVLRGTRRQCPAPPRQAPRPTPS